MGEDYMMYSYNGLLFSPEKKEILSYAIACIQLEDIMLNEIGQTRTMWFTYIKYVK